MHVSTVKYTDSLCTGDRQSCRRNSCMLEEWNKNKNRMGDILREEW